MGRRRNLADAQRSSAECAEHGKGTAQALDTDRRAGHGTLGCVSWWLGVPLYGIVPRCGTTRRVVAVAPEAQMAPDAGEDNQGGESFDLSALADDELVEQMHNDLYDGMAAEITEGTNLLL